MIAPPAIQALSRTETVLQLHFTDGSRSEIPAVWLADNDPVHRDAHSGQRLIDVADLPALPLLRAARLQDGQVILEWQDGLPASRFDAGWLACEARRPAAGAAREVLVWPAGAQCDAGRDGAWLSLAELAGSAAGAVPEVCGGSPARVAGWFRRLEAEGLAFLRGVPPEDGAILGAAAHIGLVQETNYGRLFDVRATPRAENLAYTDLGLGLHTDNPYRDPVPGFQVLHCLLAAADGGDSLFADGFAIAAALRAADPDAFELLSATPVRFAWRSATAALRATRPLIQLGAAGEVIAVHYNNRSIEPLSLASPGLPAFYAAYRRFAQLLREPRFQLRVCLAAGELVVFDNWRILHARTAFRAARHLQGCYLTRDSVFSRCALVRDAFAGDAVR